MLNSDGIMRTISPSIDRIGTALKALRRAHAQSPESEDKLDLGIKCLDAVIAQLSEEGVSAEDLQPLAALEALLRRMKVEERPQSAAANRRKGRPPSDTLLARASAVIDLLIKAGYDESKAAQTVMRLLMAAGVPAPLKGGDARGWRRLLEWRASLVHGTVSPEARAEFEDFTQEIEAIPAQERVKRVLDDQLWDRRRERR
jgi:hypothetical protein